MFSHSALIIDDDAWIRRILCKMLLTNGFEKCHHANNGYEGIAKATLFLPSLILLDVEMPELDGKQTLRILKQAEYIKHIPVLIVSGTLSPDIVSEMLMLGASNIIGKPFTAATIHQKLLQIFGESGLRKISTRQELFDLPFLKSSSSTNKKLSLDDDSEFDINSTEQSKQTSPDSTRTTEINISSPQKNNLQNIQNKSDGGNKEAVRAYSDYVTKNEDTIKELLENLPK